MRSVINQPSHYYKSFHLIRRATSVLQFLLICSSSGSAQQCTRTHSQPDINHSCPFFSSEAYTIETFKYGRALFQKECCDERGVNWNQAAIRGCIATKCISYQTENPCGTLPRYIVRGQHVPYEDVKRDHCPNNGEDGKWGQMAVCCPPNSHANLLASAYGTELNEFPHMARLETEDKVCGGTVYNYNTVITAAHCVIDEYGNYKNPRTFRLILGVNIVTSGSGAVRAGKNVYPVESIIVHPDYSLNRGHPEFGRISHRRRIYNDIALLRIGRSIDFSQNIRALPIAPPNFSPGQYASHVTAVGWGTGDDGVTSQFLQKTNLKVRRDQQCFKGFYEGPPYPDMDEVSDQLHCFGGILNGDFSPVAGKSDSGGPAICKGPDGHAVLCGIMSFGSDVEQCMRNVDENTCTPSVYADVSYFRDWIQYNAGDQDWGTPMWRKLLFGDYKHWSEFRHQVKIYSDQGPINCGGTLVSRDTVVTAGHCVFTVNRGPRSGLRVITSAGGVYWPRIGGLVIPGGFARYGIIRGLKSTSYQGHTWIDNLAVLKLAWEVPLSSESIPSLPSGTFSVPPLVKELAWPVDKSKQPDHIIKRYFKTLPENECKRRLERLRMLGAVTNLSEMDKFMCGVEEYSGGGICERMLGGGVICPGSGAGTLCGVQTFRFCDTSVPTPFLRVDQYLGDIVRSI